MSLTADDQVHGRVVAGAERRVLREDDDLPAGAPEERCRGLDVLIGLATGAERVLVYLLGH